jgi:hypothetical protein
MSDEKPTIKQAKTPIFKKWWLWVIVAIIVIAIGVSASQSGKQADETNKTVDDNSSQQTDENGAENSQKTEDKAKLTLDDGWSIDQSSPYFTYVDGYVSNNTSEDINNYVQITFSAYDGSGANVGDCLDNANTVDANGKWKFHAMCSGENIKEVKFKEITGF